MYFPSLLKSHKFHVSTFMYPSIFPFPTLQSFTDIAFLIDLHDPGPSNPLIKFALLSRECIMAHMKWFITSIWKEQIIMTSREKRDDLLPCQSLRVDKIYNRLLKSHYFSGLALVQWHNSFCYQSNRLMNRHEFTPQHSVGRPQRIVLRP